MKKVDDKTYGMIIIGQRMASSQKSFKLSFTEIGGLVAISNLFDNSLLKSSFI